MIFKTSVLRQKLMGKDLVNGRASRGVPVRHSAEEVFQDIVHAKLFNKRFHIKPTSIANNAFSRGRWRVGELSREACVQDNAKRVHVDRFSDGDFFRPDIPFRDFRCDITGASRNPANRHGLFLLRKSKVRDDTRSVGVHEDVLRLDVPVYISGVVDCLQAEGDVLRHAPQLARIEQLFHDIIK
ncbi:hypothetical protein ATCV1_z610L [Acanthocystis turfacea chlorella virus 1]|uniref:Uncharacterized protein z610L n=1 Tax=Chlorovirus heliozoae TaxID=322019 RepID=A7K9M0_9PHYC|nr:hypothetical protein ATCV1_z610L [Acanthocystis turfacea chlorella virus 1]ABT16744.1 hypothetical protein ATCV1_z610L [Acanthocystis turfacea chlorella virus 1]